MRTSRPLSRSATRCARSSPPSSNVAPENLSLATSTTNGCNMVVAGLGLGPGDEVVTTDGEHFGLLGRARRLAGPPPRGAGPRASARSGARRACSPRSRRERASSRLSHVCWMSGNRFPVAELKEATGLPILIDGAQSVGAIPVDASGFDYYAFSCQKWLCGPDSMGGLTLADPDSLPLTAPSYFAQASHDEEGGFELRAGAGRFDPGWTPLPRWPGSRPRWTAGPTGPSNTPRRRPPAAASCSPSAPRWSLRASRRRSSPSASRRTRPSS